MPARPQVVAFDVIETLMPLEPLRQRIIAVGQPPHLLELWFTRILRDGAMLAATGDNAPFGEVAALALRAASPEGIGSAEVEHVMAGFAELPAHPDVRGAFDRLSAAGVRLACLTNGSRRLTESFLDRTGLGKYVEQVISADDAGTWKPPATIYHHAASRLEASPERIALVAAHAWDCHGAKRAGLLAGWICRTERVYPRFFVHPDVASDDLLRVADALLRLPAGQEDAG